MSALALFLLWLHPLVTPLANNQYIKVSAFPDRIRLAYTVWFGETPAQAERRQMDTNHDGAITAEEARAFGRAYARTVEQKVLLTVDEKPLPVRFEESLVGLGTERSTRAAAFSVDLVATLAIPPASGHRIAIETRLEPLPLGETDIVLDEAPGTRIADARPGVTRGTPNSAPLTFTWTGPRHSDLEQRQVRFLMTRDASGDEPHAHPKNRRVWPFGLVGTLAGAALALWQIFRKR